MDFYKILSRLLYKANEIELSESQMKIEQNQKEKIYKDFNKLLILLYSYDIKNEEFENFRTYFLEYLKDIIKKSIIYFSNNDKIYIKKILNDVSNQNNIYNKNENIKDNRNMDDIIYKKKEHYESNPTYAEYNNKLDNKNLILKDDKEEREIICKNNNMKNIDNINFNINNNINSNINNLNLDNNFKYVLNELNNYISYDNLNNFKIINDENSFSDIKNINFKLNNKNKNEDKKCNNNIVQIQNTKNFHNKNKFINHNDMNNNLTLNNPKEISNNNNMFNNKIKCMKNKENTYEDGKERNIEVKPTIINYNDDTCINSYSNDNNGKDRNNNFINYINGKENINHNKNYKNFNEINKDINKEINNMNSKNKDIHKQDESSKQNHIENNKRKNSANNYIYLTEKYEKEIEQYYNILFKNNITNYFIKSIINKVNLNPICTKVFLLLSKNKIEYISQIYKEKLVTIICILYPFSKKLKLKIGEILFKTDEKADKDLFKFLRESILIPDDSKILDSLFCFSRTKMENFSKNFCTNLYLKKEDYGKNILFYIYTFLVISRNLRNFKNINECERKFFDLLLEKEYLITFKLHFILEHPEFYE